MKMHVEPIFKSSLYSVINANINIPEGIAASIIEIFVYKEGNENTMHNINTTAGYNNDFNKNVNPITL
ncbi:hypothetical protein MBBWO_11830 [Methanobrevibacter woesei]|uniref:Uncharacterized protein n=1 Tax=Methanobrevibacter woesei TaxID=190976 RepID=A0A2U1S8L2_9EURY|nr:hypothetical protein [Methanobrevibacter woesei]PWB86328.1 hypothetical protein MBBWO_11830 [Methanobrevibacter woesei]